jgi:PAS domain-containing protein
MVRCGSFNASAQVVSDGSGRPTRMIGTAQDITERREHIAALQAANAELAAAHAKATRSRDNLRKVLESIPDAVVMTRLDGSVAFVNGPGQRMSEMSASAATWSASWRSRSVWPR